MSEIVMEREDAVGCGFDPVELMDTMLADMARQDALHQPTAFWADASQHIAAELRAEGFARFRRLSGPRSFFVPSYGPPGNTLSDTMVAELEATVLRHVAAGSKTHATLMDMLSGSAWATADYRVMLAGDRPEFAPDLSRVSESPVGDPPDQLEIDGRRFSRSMLYYLHGLTFLKQQLGEVGIRTVLEIGGGYGTLGEILHQAGPEYAYLDVDIAPTAAVSSYYLASQPGLRLIDYLVTRDADTIEVPSPGTHMVLCPWQLPQVRGRVDLLWNSISFQEMEPHVVRFYLAEARRLEARWVLLRNLREGKQSRRDGHAVGVDEPVRADDYDRMLPDYRLVATNVFPFGYRTVDGFHSEFRLYERR